MNIATTPTQQTACLPTQNQIQIVKLEAGLNDIQGLNSTQTLQLNKFAAGRIYLPNGRSV